MATFSALKTEWIRLHNHSAVFAHLLKQLEELLPDEFEGGAEPQKLMSELGPVSPEIIEEVIGILRAEYHTPIKQEIEALEGTEVKNGKRKTRKKSGTIKGRPPLTKKPGATRSALGGSKQAPRKIQIRK